MIQLVLTDGQNVCCNKISMMRKEGRSVFPYSLFFSVQNFLHFFLVKAKKKKIVNPKHLRIVKGG